MRMITGGSWAVLLATLLCGRALNGAAACESLSSLALPDTAITLAQMVPAAGFTLPGMAPAAVQQFSRLPAFCRVAARLTPSSDSDIKIEVWLPATGWNGKFQAVGNGGWAGNISYAALALALQEGYATASTDTGHTGGNASFAIGHREKVIDFAYRAVHEMAVKSKAIIAAFYDRAPRLSYWTGCSTGGRQGLMAAQHYPEDFDGIIAGAPQIALLIVTRWLPPCYGTGA
jgi:Tannase and feruloyl esterase